MKLLYEKGRGTRIKNRFLFMEIVYRKDTDEEIDYPQYNHKLKRWMLQTEIESKH